MTRQTTEALIAEARQFARTWGKATDNGDLFYRLADRLEVVAKDSSTGQQMHAYWQQRAEEAEREINHMEGDCTDHQGRMKDERDAYAAVIEKVREQIEHTMHPDRYKARCGVCRLDTILTSAPADALREAKADAWDRGWYVGYRDHSEDPLANMSDNPYREEQDCG